MKTHSLKRLAQAVIHDLRQRTGLERVPKDAMRWASFFQKTGLPHLSKRDLFDAYLAGHDGLREGLEDFVRDEGNK